MPAPARPVRRASTALPTLHDMTMFRLYRAWSAANPIFTRLCEGRYGITRREWRILAVITQHETLTSTAAAKAASLDAARTSRAIGALCNKGLVARQRDPSDARIVHVFATEKGHALYREMMPVIASFNDMVFQDLSAVELRKLNDILDRIIYRAARMLDEDLVKERLHRGRSSR